MKLNYTQHGSGAGRTWLSMLMYLFILCGFHNTQAQKVIIDDPLTDGTTSGIQVGGSFTSEGYVPNDQDSGLTLSHIRYNIETVREGYLEFEIKGMTVDAGDEFGDRANVGLCAMYDGRGAAEPINYFGHLKQNFYRWNVHYRSNRDIMKCVISCSNKSPERINATRAIYPNGPGNDIEDRDWSKEPQGQAVDWDPTLGTLYVLNGRIKLSEFLLMVSMQWQAAGPYDYAPIDHRVWVGSTPADNAKYGALVRGLTYRNVKLVCTASECEDDGGEELPAPTYYGLNTSVPSNWGTISNSNPQTEYAANATTQLTATANSVTDLLVGVVMRLVQTIL